VSHYILSQRTKQDIQDIIKRSVQEFGEAQTLKYMAELERTIVYLAENPDIGRSFTHRRTSEEYRRHTCVSHVVYYRKRKDDIFILRILHGKMLPENHL
jgi:toxin ParE1/3/4